MVGWLMAARGGHTPEVPTYYVLTGCNIIGVGMLFNDEFVVSYPLDNPLSVRDKSAVATIATALHTAELRIGGTIVDRLLVPTISAGTFVSQWVSLGNPSPPLNVHQGLYQVDDGTLKLPNDIPGELRVATERDRNLVVQWFSEFYREASPNQVVDSQSVEDFAAHCVKYGSTYLWIVEGKPVSLAGYIATPNEWAHIGQVYTPSENRGKGYASACVASLSHLM